MDPLVPYLLLTLAFSALFSGSEIAFFSANKLSIELGKDSSRSGRILGFFNRHSSDFIGAMLIGNNIALVIFGILMARLLEPWLLILLPGSPPAEWMMIISQTLVTTAVVLFFGEFMPKTLFRLEPLGTLRVLAPLLQAIYLLLYVPVKATGYLTRLLLGQDFAKGMSQGGQVFSKTDLQHFVEQNTRETDELGGIDTELFENALNLREVKVRECMVPRNEVEGVSINSSIDELKRVFVQSGYSRLPIYFKSLDNMLGYVHHFDLLNRPRNIGSVLMTIPVVPETMTARDLLGVFRREKKNIAQVVDEFGGTAGIVTMEDVLEELFGEINDEHDEEDLLEKQLSAQEYMFSGRLEIDYLNEKYHLNLPEGEYETLAGYIMSVTGRIPEMNQKIIMGHLEFHILYASGKRIETVKLRLRSTGA
jgi:putative hemolysin